MDILEFLHQMGRCASADPEAFFPEKPGSDGSAAAKRLCASCDVRDACLEYAIPNELYGIWGGTSERQRQKMRADRGITMRDVGTVA